MRREFEVGFGTERDLKAVDEVEGDLAPHWFD